VNWSGDRKTDYSGPNIIWPMVMVYKLTGDRRLLDFCEDYARFLNTHAEWNPVRCYPVGQTGGFNHFSLELNSWHIVAYGSRSQLPGILSLANGCEDYKNDTVFAFDDFVRRVGLQPTYMPTSYLEHTGPVGCTIETEYCIFTDWMESIQWLSRLTGEARFGDWIERMVFNAPMGARKKDERAIAYLTTPNQLRATRNSTTSGWIEYYQTYAPCLFPACCPAQSIRLMPAYLLLSVLRNRAGDLVLHNYGPCQVKTPEVALDVETQYPFGDTVKIRVDAPKGWKGALRLRRPAWVKDCTIRRNGRAVAARCERDWLVLEGPWGRDEVDLAFVNEPVIRTAPELGMNEPMRVVEYGPLVFAQPVKTRWTPCARMHPTRPFPDEWSWFEATCAEKPVIYAMPVETAFDASKIRVKRVETADYPWENSPLRLTVPMVRAAAAYPPDPETCQHTPAPLCNPAPADAGAEVEDVEFVPIGATNLRFTCFPLAGKPKTARTPAKTDRPRIAAQVLPFADARRTRTGSAVRTPSLAVSPKNGRLWACWSAGATEVADETGYGVLATSADEGRTWKKVLVCETGAGLPRAIFEPHVWIAPDGRLRWTWTDRAGTGLGDPAQDQLWMITLDAEHEPPAKLPPPTCVGRGVMVCKPLTLKSGETFVPASCPGEQASAGFYVTRNFETFEKAGAITPVRWSGSYDAYQAIELKDGSLWCLGEANKNHGGMWESYSRDKGRTWCSTRVPWILRHTTSRFFITRLASGNMLLVKNGPAVLDVGPKELTAYISRDDGATWNAGLSIDTRLGAVNPDGQQLADGRIALVYEYADKAAHEFNLVLLTEADILSGKNENVVRRPIAAKPGGVQLWENGPFWAECNVGASKPEEYGYYFRWGDTVGYTRKGGDWIDGYYCFGVSWMPSREKQARADPFAIAACPTYGKSLAELRAAGYVDGAGNLVAAHDAATAHLGAPWRMPTAADMAALFAHCDTTVTTREGVKGRLVTGRGAFAARSIFLPATGYGDGSGLYDLDEYGSYWSATPHADTSSRACGLHVTSGHFARQDDYRFYGQAVRPLRP